MDGRCDFNMPPEVPWGIEIRGGGGGLRCVLANSLNPDPTAYLISTGLQSVCIRVLKTVEKQ